MEDDRKKLAENPELPTVDDVTSPEYRPLSVSQNNLMIEFQKRILAEIDKLYEESQTLPTKDEIMATNNGKDANGEQIEWRWTKEEKENAVRWASLPLIRCRFLRARSWKIENSLTMIVATIKWRRTVFGCGVEGVNEDMIRNELSSGKAFYHRYDKRGRPVCYVRCKLHDSNSRNLEELQQLCVWIMENEWKIYKNNVFRMCVMFDLEGFSLKNMDYAFTKFMIFMLQNHFPDALGVCLILNSPWLFRACWNILKGWIDPASQDKIIFANLNDVKNYIDADSLPKSYGGNEDFNYVYQYPFPPFADHSA